MTKARDIASATTPNANAALLATFPHRNLIINGAMQVAQRGTSVSGLSSIGLNTVDRFNGNSATAGSFTLTDEQSSDAPAGFNYSRKLTFTTAQTTSAGTRNQVRHHIEGYNTAHLDWGTADAKTVTLSFWVKSSVTGSMAVAFINQTETHSYVTDYTVSSANTWEYKTIVVEGPTVGAWNTNNTIGIRLSWDLGSGSTYQTPTSDAWVSGWYYRTSSSVRPTETLNATWQITGVQLEVGDTATPFEHRSYGEELSLCQRYFQKVFAGADNRYLAGTSPCIFWNSSNTDNGGITFVKKMRAAPTFSYNALKLRSPYAGNYTIGTLAANAITVDGLTTTTSGSSGSSNERVAYLAGTSTSSYYQIDAEL
jgi:hypothetical protein